MKKYKVNFEQITTGYVEVFADNEDHAVQVLYNQKPFRESLEIVSEEMDFSNPTEITV